MKMPSERLVVRSKGGEQWSVVGQLNKRKKLASIAVKTGGRRDVWEKGVPYHFLDVGLAYVPKCCEHTVWEVGLMPPR